MAALTTIAAISALASAGYSIFEDATRKAPVVPAAVALPAAPDPSVEAKATEAQLSRGKQKAPIAGSVSGSAATLLAGPAPAAATTQTKTLLGL